MGESFVKLKSFVIHSFVLSILCCPVLFGQASPTQLDALFASRPSPINGNVLIAENGRVIYQRSFGFADFKNRIANSASSRFNIASISKTFTAVAVLQLKEKGRLNLEDPVKKHLPSFPFVDITIRHLLSNTSGLPDIELFDNVNNKIINNQQVLPALNRWKTPLSFKPGDKWEYSNVNFNLLLLVVEKVSGQDFRRYIQENIFSKAKMTDTYLLEDYLNIRQDKSRVINHQFLQLYSDKPLDVQNKIFPFVVGLRRLSGLKGDSDVITTTGDLLKYDQCLYVRRRSAESIYLERGVYSYKAQ